MSTRLPPNVSPTSTLFDRVRFVLVETNHPGNVGSVARAMKTMGFSSLYLVNPRCANVRTHRDAIALASGALDVLENAVIVNTIQEALQGCEVTAALSARLREFSPPVCDPRELSVMLNRPETNGVVALILGNERNGLPNEIVEKCNYLVNIPANPAYSSLNLAQAVQVLAYELRYACVGNIKMDTGIGMKGELAEASEVEGMFEHLEQALVAIHFLNPDQPKKLMSRLRRLFARTQLEVEEVNILRGIAKKMLNK